MSRRLAVQLPETFDFRHRQIVAAQVQPGVEEHTAVAGGEHKIIAIDPTWFVGVMAEGVTLKDGAHLRATQWQAEMTRLRSVDGVNAKAARLGSRAGEDFEIQAHRRTLYANRAGVEW